MRAIITALAFVFIFSPLSALAGSGHSHGHSHDQPHQANPITQSEAEALATTQVQTIVDKGKLDASWKVASVDSSSKKMFNGREEWVVSFKNDKATEPTKSMLYIFLGVTGDYIAANHTGK